MGTGTTDSLLPPPLSRTQHILLHPPHTAGTPTLGEEGTQLAGSQRHSPREQSSTHEQRHIQIQRQTQMERHMQVHTHTTDTFKYKETLKYRIRFKESDYTLTKRHTPGHDAVGAGGLRLLQGFPAPGWAARRRPSPHSRPAPRPGRKHS